MNDLEERLAALGSPARVPSEAVIAADVARARAAAHARRRARSALAAGALSLTLVGGGAALAVVTTDQPHPPASTLSATADLVAYTGPQPEGFRVAWVPEGYVVQGSDEFTLTIAPADSQTHYLDFAGKIAIFLESALAPAGEMPGDPVTVNGYPGAIRHSGTSTILEYHDGAHEILVQAADSVRLTQDQLLELASGVEVTTNVRVGDSGGTPTTVDEVTRDGSKAWRVVPTSPEDRSQPQG